MAKEKNKQAEELVALTEWQKRNIEFLKKKKQQAEEERKLKEKLLSEKIPLQVDSEVVETKEISEEVKEKAVEEKVTSKLKKEKKIKAPKEKSLGQLAFQKALPVLLLASVVMVASIFMITPYSKVKKFSVKGNRRTNLEALVKASKVKTTDYWLTLLASPGPYEQAILRSNPWVKRVSITYEFPNHFQFNVTEFDIIAYAQVDGGYQPILENGKRVAKITQSELPKSFLILNLEDEQAIQDLVKRLSKLPKKLVKSIKSISLANSKTTPDLLLIEMQDGNLIRVPQSQVTVKLPYYQKLKKNLESGSIIDMEVGIYRTTEAIENQPETPIKSQQNDSDKKDEKSVDNQEQTRTEQTTETR
ncbi:cell division protein FtsQ/DivIB [Streptococcus castoreus]|uniref:cell division protein FtsQ/DivIB n=1 Tax=Streptococcus castoreus TaxID=254786 RepID=UPI0003F9AAA0|nr:FtsQ-type POTRA domain-containing protein [Streptococcus castoreus]